MNNIIRELLQKNHGCFISTEDAALLQKKFSLSQNELMLALLPFAKEKALMPVVHYLVGAVGLGESGNLYLGGCQDFGYGPINQTVHAEQAVISNAFILGETGITKIACTDVPCGHCRQFLYELQTAEILEFILLNLPPLSLTTLLPYPFGPQALGKECTLLKKVSHDITLPQDIKINSRILAAFNAAKQSYAPYTQAYAGVAIEMKNKKIYAGKYIEMVAHNPSLPPMQAALIYLTQCGKKYSDIAAATLVQCQRNLIDQSINSQITLHAANRKIELEIIAC